MVHDALPQVHLIEHLGGGEDRCNIIRKASAPAPASDETLS
jgi:hypothetical protein